MKEDPFKSKVKEEWKERYKTVRSEEINPLELKAAKFEHLKITLELLEAQLSFTNNKSLTLIDRRYRTGRLSITSYKKIKNTFSKRRDKIQLNIKKIKKQLEEYWI